MSPLLPPPVVPLTGSSALAPFPVLPGNGPPELVRLSTALGRLKWELRGPDRQAMEDAVTRCVGGFRQGGLAAVAWALARVGSQAPGMRLAAAMEKALMTDEALGGMSVTACAQVRRGRVLSWGARTSV